MTSPGPRIRKPYARLDRELIIQAGLAIAARPGTTAVRVRDLGVELGADPSAIYRHFLNIEELNSALTDRLTELVLEQLQGDPADWRNYLAEGARVMLGTFVQYPCLGARAAAARPVGAGELQLAERTLLCLQHAGLQGVELARYYSAISGYVLGLISVASAERMNPEPTVDSWVNAAVGIGPETHPTLAAVREYIVGLEFEDTFMTGIGAILDGVESVGAGALRR